jgi:alpha-1,3-rhamnosyl/mannosyltransferase
MRILFDARRLVSRATGIGRIIDGLLPALARLDTRNNYLVVIGERNPLDGPGADNFEVRRSGLPLNSLRVNTAMPALARAWRADVAYFPFWLAPLVMPCPTVVAIHDLIQVYEPHGVSWSQRVTSRTYTWAIVRRARRLHALAAYGRETLREVFGVSPDRVDVVSPAVSFRLDGHEDDGAPPSLTPERWGSRPFALYVGNHKPHKNLERLLRAFARVADRLESNLVVVGAKSSLDDPRSLPHVQLAAELGLAERVHFAGQVDDEALRRWYRAARFFVFPSLHEGFGLPPLEAMTCGTPVICSNTTSLPEVVGDAALTFDPLAVEAIASALCRVDESAELRADLSRRGRIQAARFSWSRSAEAWLASLERAAD